MRASSLWSVLDWTIIVASITFAVGAYAIPVPVHDPSSTQVAHLVAKCGK